MDVLRRLTGYQAHGATRVPPLSETVSPAFSHAGVSGLLKEKVTVPPGVPVAGATGATAAVMVTVSPVTLGLSDDVSVVVVPPWTTISSSAAEADDASLVSPP